VCGQRPARSGLEERCLSWDDCSRPALCAVLAAGWVRLQQVPRAALASLLAWADVLRTNCSRPWEAPPAAERLAPSASAPGRGAHGRRRAPCELPLAGLRPSLAPPRAALLCAPPVAAPCGRPLPLRKNKQKGNPILPTKQTEQIKSNHE